MSPLGAETTFPSLPALLRQTVKRFREGAKLTSAEVRAFCRDNLGNHEVPRKVFFMPELPKNATGKVMKRELRRHGELERGVDSCKQGMYLGQGD